jgi:molybdopterin synthase sulfur carrier subunit
MMRLKLAYGREQLLSEFPGSERVTVAQVLSSIKTSHPRIYNRWCDQEGRLMTGLPVFVNGEHIRYLKGMDTALENGDEVYVIPAITGG